MLRLQRSLTVPYGYLYFVLLQYYIYIIYVPIYTCACDYKTHNIDIVTVLYYIDGQRSNRFQRLKNNDLTMLFLVENK